MTVLDESSRIEASLLDELDVLVGSVATQSPICITTEVRHTHSPKRICKRGMGGKCDSGYPIFLQSDLMVNRQGKQRSSLVIGTPASPPSSNITSNDCAEANCNTGNLKILFNNQPSTKHASARS